MQDFDVIPTLGTELVAVMHYLEPDGSLTLIFTPGSSVEQILIQFSNATGSARRICALLNKQQNQFIYFSKVHKNNCFNNTI
jgi:hypothetical protein